MHRLDASLKAQSEMANNDEFPFKMQIFLDPSREQNYRGDLRKKAIWKFKSRHNENDDNDRAQLAWLRNRFGDFLELIASRARVIKMREKLRGEQLKDAKDGNGHVSLW